MRILLMITVLALVSFLIFWLHPFSEADGKKENAEKEALKALTQQWETEVRDKTQKDPALKKLVGKYPRELIISRRIYNDYLLATYSFIYETRDLPGSGELQFQGGDFPSDINWRLTVGQQNLVVDLEKWDFEKDPDPKKISIAHPKVYSTSCKAVVGHVYLERVRDDRGNNFYVLFQVVDLDPQSRYMAFIWRKLPGGTVVKD